MQFVQHLLVAVVVYVSIGLYSLFYVVRSLTTVQTRHGVRGRLLLYPQKQPNGELYPEQHELPASPKDMPLGGLFIGAILGIFAVPVFLLVFGLAHRWATVHRLVVEWLFIRRPQWPDVNRVLER